MEWVDLHSSKRQGFPAATHAAPWASIHAIGNSTESTLPALVSSRPHHRRFHQHSHETPRGNSQCSGYIWNVPKSSVSISRFFAKSVPSLNWKG